MKRMLSLLLAAALLLGASACSPGGGEGQRAMGRYVEQELTLPESVFEVQSFRGSADGGLDLLAYMGTEGDTKVYLRWYHSPDGGLTWEKQDCPVLDQQFNPQESSLFLDAAAWDSQGRLWLSYQDYSDDGGERPSSIARIETDGALTNLPWSAPQPSDGSGLLNMKAAENGDLLFGAWSEITQVDSETGAVKETYAPKDSMNATDGWDVAGNTLWTSEGDTLYSYDLTTGSEGESLPADAITGEGNSDYGMVYRAVSAGPDGVYYATDHGIFRGVPGSSVGERLADGSLTTLGTPTLRRVGMAAAGEVFVVLGHDGNQYRLYAYRYDPTVPTLAERELTVWSLYDQPLIRQAIGAFQKTHSDVYVSYTAALTEGGSVTRDDALKALATELVAGKGPDVLVLDGTPMESYEAKGVLGDLSATLEPLMADGTLMRNFAGAYQRADGALYTVPAGFAVPVMHGDVAGITTLEEMADWVEANRGSFVHPLAINTPEDYLTLLSTPADLEDEGTLRAVLTNLKRIYDVEQAKPFEDGMQSMWGFQFGALAWMVGNVGLDVGALQTFDCLYAAWATSEKNGTGTVDALYGGDMFIPHTVLGISAQSKQGELGADFVKTVLSQEVQASNMGWIPVNADAFEASTLEDTSMGRNGHFSTYGTSFLDAEGADVPVNFTIDYPPQAWRDEMADLIRGLKTPVNVEGPVLQLVMENTADYFEGRATLDETMQLLMQKLTLYRSEQG